MGGQLESKMAGDDCVEWGFNCIKFDFLGLQSQFIRLINEYSVELNRCPALIAVRPLLQLNPTRTAIPLIAICILKFGARECIQATTEAIQPSTMHTTNAAR